MASKASLRLFVTDPPPLVRRNPEFRPVLMLTGASSGLGLAIAKELLAEDHYFLILTARESSHFRHLTAHVNGSKNVWLEHLDISDSEQIRILMNAIQNQLGGVDILVNNAGIIDRATVEDSSHELRYKQLEVNYLGPFTIISLAISWMRRHQFGRIINISSAAGFFALPTLSAYSASKHALDAATESLWYEVRPWGVHVTLVIPGCINSEAFRNTSEEQRVAQAQSDSNSVYHHHYCGMRQWIGSLMKRSRSTNESVARKVIEVLNQTNPPLHVYATLDARVLSLLKKLVPNSWFMYWFYRQLPGVSKWGSRYLAP